GVGRGVARVPGVPGPRAGAARVGAPRGDLARVLCPHRLAERPPRRRPPGRTGRRAGRPRRGADTGRPSAPRDDAEPVWSASMTWMSTLSVRHTDEQVLHRL